MEKAAEAENRPFVAFLPTPEERVEAALADYRAGRMVVLTDDEDRENEGDLCFPSEKVTPEAINFMAREGRGLICLTLTEERVDHLRLPLMVPENTSRFETAFTISIEARRGVTTGISAADRAHTVLTAIHPDTRPEDLARPGHIFPLRARPGGVLVRAGQTEGSVDLARMAGLYPSSVICEVMNDDGTMARMPDLIEFGTRHHIHILTVADLIRYRLRQDRLVHRVGELPIDTRWGTLKGILYRNDVTQAQHLLLTIGEPKMDEPVLVRVHTANPLEDVFGIRAGVNTVDLDGAIRRIQQAGGGMLLYLYAGGRKETLSTDWKVLGLRASGTPTTEAQARLGVIHDSRDIGLGAQILVDAGLTRIRLLTNSTNMLKAVDGYGLEVVGHQPV